MKRQTATVDCPKSMVGRVIGKNGETIKALQTYTGALIQIDQTVEPTKVTISGTPHSLSLAVAMVTDIVKGTFKGFALLRQLATPGTIRPQPYPTHPSQPRPMYAPGYGLIPPSQLSGADDRAAGLMALPCAAPFGARPILPKGWRGPSGQPVMMGLQQMGLGVGQPGVLAAGLTPLQLQQAGYMQGMGQLSPMFSQEYQQGQHGVMQGDIMYPDSNLQQQQHAYLMAQGLEMGSNQARLMQAASRGQPRGGHLQWTQAGVGPKSVMASMAAAAGASTQVAAHQQDSEDLDADNTGFPQGDYYQVMDSGGNSYLTYKR